MLGQHRVVLLARDQLGELLGQGHQSKPGLRSGDRAPVMAFKQLIDRASQLGVRAANLVQIGDALGPA